MTLNWTRTQDGDHNGKPVYEYTAIDGDCRFNIVWACDRGGMFGYTAYRRRSDGKNEPLKATSGITWGRTLKRCKDACEKINTSAKQREEV